MHIRKLDKYEKGIEYATRFTASTSANNNEIEAAKALSEIGSCYYDWSKYVEAKNILKEPWRFLRKTKILKGLPIH